MGHRQVSQAASLNDSVAHLLRGLERHFHLLSCVDQIAAPQMNEPRCKLNMRKLGQITRVSCALAR